jgi:hypothetical protein
MNCATTGVRAMNDGPRHFRNACVTLMGMSGVMGALLVTRDARAQCGQLCQSQTDYSCSVAGGCLSGLNATSSWTTAGVIGELSGGAANGFGVQGLGDSSTSIGVYGSAGGNVGPAVGGVGVYGVSRTGNGIYGTTASGSFPNAGVYGTSTASSGNRIGVIGNVTGSGSFGGDFVTDVGIAVAGSASSGLGVGLLAVASGSGGRGVHAICNGSCPGSGFAGLFDGQVQVNGTSAGAIALWIGQGTISGSQAFSAPVNAAGTTTWALPASDIRLKKNVKSLEGALDKLVQLRGVTFEWKDPTQHGNQTGPQKGFIAQEVETVFPDWVSDNADGYKTITMKGFEPIVVESIRTLKLENNALKERVKALEANRRPLNASMLGEGGLGLAVIAGALIISRRKRNSADARG